MRCVLLQNKGEVDGSKILDDKWMLYNHCCCSPFRFTFQRDGFIDEVGVRVVDVSSREGRRREVKRRRIGDKSREEGRTLDLQHPREGSHRLITWGRAS